MQGASLEISTGTSEVEAPGPDKKLVEVFTDPVDMIFVAFQPVIQRQGVMKPKVFHVNNA